MTRPTNIKRTWLRRPSSKNQQILNWWINKAEEWPCLASLAFTVLSIPAMSAEVERVFNSTKMLVTERRSKLRVETIEANECLRSWIMQGLFGDKPPQELSPARSTPRAT